MFIRFIKQLDTECVCVCVRLVEVDLSFEPKIGRKVNYFSNYSSTCLQNSYDLYQIV